MPAITARISRTIIRGLMRTTLCIVCGQPTNNGAFCDTCLQAGGR